MRTVSSELEKRAQEWRRFRSRFLFTQRDLATQLRCHPCTVTRVENRRTIPKLRTQRRFLILKRREERDEREAVA
jgi:hypothetical protein